MTHTSVTKEEREKICLVDGLIRLPVDIENANHIIDDLSQALEGLS